MKIIYLNVWGEHMQDALIDYLKEQAVDTDVFCLQEATDDMRMSCADVLSDFIAITDYKYISEEEDFAQATYVRKGLTVISSEILMHDDFQLGLVINSEILTEQGSVHVCNVHGTSKPDIKNDDPNRLLQSKTIIDFLKDKIGPVVIGGDFNLNPDTLSVKMFSEHGYRDLIDEFGIETTRNHLVWDRYPVKMLFSDYAFVNSDVALDSFTVTSNEVSDHLPLTVEITL